MQRVAVAWALAVVLACALALPAVWWEQLHVDEWVTLSVAPHSVAEIVDQVFVGKGGSPVHFFLEHFFLEWPGGVEGLRIPSLVAFALALPAAGLLARELAGSRESILLPIVFASAPLARGHESVDSSSQSLPSPARSPCGGAVDGGRPPCSLHGSWCRSCFSRFCRPAMLPRAERASTRATYCRCSRHSCSW